MLSVQFGAVQYRGTKGVFLLLNIILDAVDKGLHFFFRADGDTHIVVDSRQIKVSDEHLFAL